ncbi:hypothetical protein WG66_010650 [Moniliophthora roreri]|uniref:Uncharacterized protein n=1 Tax=Moniliophthora roreri TaxID=221103 RepID=A0A0W0F9Y6_MONRR|nr:hypothetical protein WG66_010650 [Moniliophthora roreri]
MSEPHKAFLIARLIPSSSKGEQSKAYYRCIAAFQHRWSYTFPQIAAVRRFLDLLSNAENANIVRDEIRRAQGKYARQGKRPAMPALSFPYTQFLFSQAWNMDIDNPSTPYVTGIGFEQSVFNPNIGCFSHGSSINGIAIIDITDPSDPAYCYSLDRRDICILTAERYVRIYYKDEDGESESEGGSEDEGEGEGDILEIDDDGDDPEGERIAQEIKANAMRHAASLKVVRLLTRDVLAEVWPEHFSGNGLPGHEELLIKQETDLHRSLLPPLADLALSQLVKQCALDDDWGPLEQLADMPGKPEVIAAALISQKDIPDSGSALLAKFLLSEVGKNGGIVDLSRFTLSVDAIRVMLPLFPCDTSMSLLRIRTCLTLLNTNITNKQVMGLLATKPEAFYRLHDFVHPALLVRVSPPSNANIPKDLPAAFEDLQALHKRISTAPRGFTFMQADKVNLLDGQIASMTSIPFFHSEKVLLRLTKFFTDSFVGSQLGPSMVLAAGTPLRSQPRDMNERQHWLHRWISMVPIRGIYDTWRAHEWTFALNCTPHFKRRQEPTYAFIKVDEEAHNEWLFNMLKEEWEVNEGKKNGEAPKDVSGVAITPFSLENVKVYDVRGFADAIEKEGRPRPSEEVMVAFEEAIAGGRIRRSVPTGFLEVPPLVLMDIEEAKQYIFAN